MKIAFYKGTRKGLAGIYSRGVRLVTKGRYSHCEVVFNNGMSASASFIDKGVRFKRIEYDPANWDFLEIDDKYELNAWKWFKEHEGESYDLLGNIHFLLPFVGDDRHKWSCAESVAEALQIRDSWRIHPNSLYALISSFIVVNPKKEDMNKFYMSADTETPTDPDEPVKDAGDGLPPRKPPTNP